MAGVGHRVSSPTFVGRRDQLEALSSALSDAEGGEARAVFVGGESGVGKTRLVAEFEQLAQARRFRLLLGACVDVGGSQLPYAPVLGMLRTLVRETDARMLEDMVGPAGGELARLLPELPGAGGTSDAVDPLAQSRLFEALLGLFARVSGDLPLVLVVEDLHWGDPSSRGFLSFLVRNMRRERLLLLATYRTDELHRRHPLRQFLADVERLPLVERLQLAPFTERELAQQLTAILEQPPDPRLVDELFARSEGNAFFAEELLAAAGEAGAHRVPENLRDALTLRVEQLSLPARTMVRSAAVAGSVVGHRLLAATAGLADEDLVQALREALENNVLVQEPASDGYAFRHTLLRDALYDELLPGERGALHAALARSLELDPGLAVGAHGAAAQRAMHWAAAHELAAALDASVEAGAEAERVWAFAEANRHFERAAELRERVPSHKRSDEQSVADLLRRAAQAAHLAGENDRAITLARNALTVTDEAQEPAVAGLVHERLGRYLLADGVPLDALEEYRVAATLLPVEPTAIRASILAGEGHILMLEGDLLRARGPCEEAVRIARQVGASDVECDALNTLGVVLLMLGAPDQGIELLLRAKRLAEELGALEELLRSYVNLGEALDQAGRLDEAAQLAIEGWERLRQSTGTVAPFLTSEAGARLIRLGRWDQALALLGAAAEAAPPNIYGSMMLDALVEVEVLRGELDLARAHLEASARLIATSTEMWNIPHRAAAAEVALACGRPEELRTIVDLDDPIPTGHAVFFMPLLALATAAEADLASRARAARDSVAEQHAVTRAQALLERVAALVAPETWPLGPPPTETRLLGELCELNAQRAGAGARADEWAALAERWDQLGRPWRSAYARLREAESALSENQPRGRTAAALASARISAAGLGATPLLEEIELVARRARIRGVEPGDGSDHIAGLTAREVDVLRLVAEGRTNPEIGKALYMSPKTASVHVSRILAKLDARTRTEAVGVAHRLGLLEERLG